MSEQCALADAGITAKHDNAAAARECVDEELVEQSAFIASSAQRDMAADLLSRHAAP